MNAEYNREHNVEIRTLTCTKGGKCRVCETHIDNDTLVIRIKIDGIKQVSITLCFDCIKYMNDLVNDYIKE